MTDDVFMIGDSHTIALTLGAEAMGVRWRGGPLAKGSALEQMFWHESGGRFALNLDLDQATRARFDGLLQYEGPILSTVGFNTNRLVKQLAAYAKSQGYDIATSMLSSAALEATVLDARKTAVDFHTLLASYDREVYFVCSPQRTIPGGYELLQAIESPLIHAIAKTGATFIDVRPTTTDESGALKTEYCRPNDRAHANMEYGRCVLTELSRLRQQKAAS